MKNVLITGISGYLGTLLARRIAREPEVEHLTGIDVKVPSFNSSKFTFYKHDVRQPLDNIFIENKIDTAVHLAFIVVPIHNEKMSHDINIQGTKNFLAASAKAKALQVFYMGSHTEYGAFKDNPECFTEDMPLHPNPDYPYPCDKAAVDLMFQDFAKEHPEICVTIGRTVAVTGPGGDACGIKELFTPVMVRAAGKNPLWQFIHEDDLAELIILLLKKKKAGIYNLTAEGGLTYSEMIKKLGKPSVTLPSWLLYQGVKFSWKLKLQTKSQPGGLFMLEYPINISNEKIKRETGYQMRYTGPEAFAAFFQSRKKTG